MPARPCGPRDMRSDCSARPASGSPPSTPCVFGLSALALILYIWWASTGIAHPAGGRRDRAPTSSPSPSAGARAGADALRDTIRDRLARGAQPDALYLLADPHAAAGGRQRSGVADRAEQRGHCRRGPGAAQWRGRPCPCLALRSRRTGITSWSDATFARAPHFATWSRAHCSGRRSSSPSSSPRARCWCRGLFRHLLLRVSDTAAAVEAGDLTRRVQLSGRGDELDRLAALINAMLDRIGQLMDGVRAVSNNIAHDLRTPVTRARARLEDAAAHAEGADELRSAAERAVADLDGVTHVFEALLRIAEIEAGARRSRLRPPRRGPVAGRPCRPLRRRCRASAGYGWSLRRAGAAAACWATRRCCSRRWPTCSTTR